MRSAIVGRVCQRGSVVSATIDHRGSVNQVGEISEGQLGGISKMGRVSENGEDQSRGWTWSLGTVNEAGEVTVRKVGENQ